MRETERDREGGREGGREGVREGGREMPYRNIDAREGLKRANKWQYHML